MVRIMPFFLTFSKFEELYVCFNIFSAGLNIINIEFLERHYMIKTFLQFCMIFFRCKVMQWRKVPQFYGFIGGKNFLVNWSTGWLYSCIRYTFTTSVNSH